MSFQYINCGNLEQLLDSNQHLPWTVRVKLAYDIAMGISYLHYKGIFHRDLTSKVLFVKLRELFNEVIRTGCLVLSLAVENCSYIRCDLRYFEKQIVIEFIELKFSSKCVDSLYANWRSNYPEGRSLFK